MLCFRRDGGDGNLFDKKDGLKMWLSKKTIETGGEKKSECKIGIVSIGGKTPCVMTEGEIRNTQRLNCGSAYIPAAGDNVLLIKTEDGECIVAGRTEGQVPNEAEAGEVYITNKPCNAFICLKNTGEILISGKMFLQGEVYINGNALNVSGA